MKCLLILVFWTSVINSIRAQETCVPTGDGNYFAGTYTNTPINDNEEGVIAVITVIGLIDVDAPSHDYLIVTWSTGEEEITISLTDEFANYERNTATTSTPNIQLQMDLLCGGSPLIVTFRQNIVDINNHEPVFDYSEYTYKLPTPFPAGVEITQLGLEIIVTDLDITNDAINFDIDSPDLDVVYYGTTDSLGKNHKAVLVPKRPLEFTSTQTFLLTATDVGEPTQSSTATIIIEIDEENSVAPTPAFSDAYYEVAYVDSETISLGISNANSDDTCNLFGDYKNYFRCEIEENQVQLIRLLGEEDPEDLEEGGYRVIVVEVAASEVRVARTVVILQLPEIIITTTACPTETTITTTACEVCEVCTTPEPQVCTTTEIITTECPIVTCEPCASTTVCPTTLDPDELTTTACPELDCSTCPTTPNSCEVCTTTVAPDCTLCPTSPPDSCSTDCDCPTTECDTENPVTSPETDCSSCTTEICEDYVCRSTTAPSVVSPCDCDCPTNATEICEEYVCRSTTAPSVVSPCDCDCTTSAEIECPEYTTPSPVEAEVSFIQETFTFSLSANEEMSQHYLPLSATSTINETITYQSEDLPSQLNLDVTNGMLTNNQPLPALIYQFSVTAVGQTSSASATATVIISVASLEVCEDGSIAASYSLLVNSVLENNEMDLLTTGFESEDIVYRFEISNVSPAAGESLFSVSPDGQTITCDELDRESSHFDDIDATQYTLTINIVSNEDEPTNIRQYRDSIFRIPSRTSPHTRATTRADSAQCILIEDIRNSATQTVLVIVVEDVNDNPPLFSPTNMVVGYPTTSLLSVIAPPYLVQVEATDADSGVNAELAYYVDNSLVTIHSTSGVVYPTDGLSDTDFTFTVTARDQNGAGLPSSNSLEVEVKILQQEHISVLTVTNALLEDVTEKLSELNIIANVNIKQLQASVLPTQNTRQTRADENYYLVIIVYALDGTNNLVTSQTLQGLLENVVGLSIGPLPDSNSSTDPPNITDPPSPTDPIDPTDPSTPTDPPNDTDGSDDPGSNTGLIAAVCVLSILLFLLLVGFAVFFYFKLRKNKSYNHMEEEDRQSSTPPQFKKNVPMGRSSSKLSYLGSDTEKAERRPTGILITNPISDPDEDSLPDSPPKERRKSVAFNSNVEQINIVTTREADDSIESSKL